MYEKNKIFRLLIKTFLVVLTIILVVVFLGWVTVRSSIQPPVIAVTKNGTAANGAMPVHEDQIIEAAFHSPEADESDADINGNRFAPEGFTSSDRKDFFYTFLIFGLDNGINTDTIMVAAYDGIAKKGYVIGIPRDSKINVRRNVKKINAAYPSGTLNGGGMAGGVLQLKKEIQTVIGFIPDYYICINLKAFVKLVDALGGVEVDVPYNMTYSDPYQNLHINIKKGFQELNGEDALKFARYRRGSRQQDTISDYQRIANQQTIIKAVLEKLLRPASLLKITEFVDIFNENVHTDISLTDMLWFAGELNEIRGLDALETYTMPTSGTTGAPSWYELLDKTAIAELVNKTINPFIKHISERDLNITN